MIASVPDLDKCSEVKGCQNRMRSPPLLSVRIYSLKVEEYDWNTDRDEDDECGRATATGPCGVNTFAWSKRTHTIAYLATRIPSPPD